jgi:protein phosphatase
MSLLCAATGRSHIGLVGEKNEDRFLIQDVPGGGTLLAVADGLGGNVAGGHAANCIMEHLAAVEKVPDGAEMQTLCSIVGALECDLECQKADHGASGGIGSTLLCVFLRSAAAYWVHVGDSRLYLFRNGRLSQVTEDQSLARFLVEEGELSAAEAASHYSINVLDQYVGCGYAVPETGRVGLQAGDLLVLTTDGLHKPLSKGTMTQILNSRENLDKKAKRLIEMALESGGQDNMTVVLFRYAP